MHAIESLINYFQKSIFSSDAINTRIRTGNRCDCKKTIIMKDPDAHFEYKICFCDDSCEHSLPHTTDAQTIMIPESYPRDQLSKTLTHEKIHLQQKRYPKLWETWYARAWGYSLHTSPPTDLPQEIQKNRRINPDTELQPFTCWRQRYWSVPVFKLAATNLRDAYTVWWDAKEKTVSSDAPDDWVDFFGHVSQNEHPHEISACFITDNSDSAAAKLIIALYNTSFFEKMY